MCNFADELREVMNMKQTTLLMMVAFLACLLSCTSSTKRTNPNASHADSVIFAAGALMHYDHMMELVDSFEQAGSITPLNANRWRGVVYYHQNQYRLAEISYRKAIKEEVKNNDDQLVYNKVARRLSELLLVKGDYEGALQVAVPAVEKMQKSGVGSDIDYAILLNNIGCCQLNLGQNEEANKSFLTARGHYANRWQSDSTSRGFQEAVVGTVYTSMAYINTHHYEEAIYWIDRTEMLLDKYRLCSDARVEYFDEYQGRIEIMRAVALEGLGKPTEAAQAYRQFLKTQYAKTPMGRINANDYLVVAERYREAADNYRYLDQTIGERGLEPSLDNIQQYLLPKYHANAMAARGDTAMAIGQYIMGLLDSAITNYKNSATAELATIYDTNQKEAEIVKQREEMTRLQFISLLIVLVLIVAFLLVYTWNRRKAAHRLRAAHEKLEDAHAKLQTAYDQLESTTKAKERIESELRIARNIQSSMVPNIFPNREGLDLYASMTPAREVGGDLYGFLLIEDDLYICVGDVSGKGVPASLFMAQATRLFRILATQHMMPNEIATRMNNVLTESNEQGMFVTMFIGLAHLKTGRLDYCNAGHNPPVLGVDGHDNFMEMETNAPIGLWPDLEFVGEHVDDIRGQMLLVYTDGLNEAENQQQEQFGDDHLLDILNHRHFNSSMELIEHLNAEVIRHRDGAAPNDDLTMLCLMIQ